MFAATHLKCAQHVMPFIFVRSSANGEIYIDCNCDEWSEMAERIERILSPARQHQVDLSKSPGCLIHTIRPHDEVLHQLVQVEFNVVASNTVGETTVSTLARRGPDPGVPNISNSIFVRNSMNMDEFQVNRVAKKAYVNKQTIILIATVLDGWLGRYSICLSCKW